MIPDTGHGAPATAGWIRLFAFLCAAAIAHWLAACADQPCDLAGVWEGQSGDSRLVVSFYANGNASIQVTSAGRTSTTSCRWERVDNRIQLTSLNGQKRSFGIVGCEADGLTLKVASGPGGVCEFRRVGAE